MPISDMCPAYSIISLLITVILIPTCREKLVCREAGDLLEANADSLKKSANSIDRLFRSAKAKPANDALMPCGCATDLSTAVEVTYSFNKSFRACPPWAGEAEKSASLGFYSERHSNSLNGIVERHLGLCSLLKQSIISQSDVLLLYFC